MATWAHTFGYVAATIEEVLLPRVFLHVIRRTKFVPAFRAFYGNRDEKAVLKGVVKKCEDNCMHSSVIGCRTRIYIVRNCEREYNGKGL